MDSRLADKARADLKDQAAFTLAELLVVVGVLTVLALLSVSALAHSQPSSDRAGCASNLRRLMQAWQMYADDHSGQLVACTGAGAWISGYMDYSAANSDNTNTVLLTNATYAAIGPYVNSASLFHCPGDSATLIYGNGPRLRARSYSMNSYVGPNPNPWNDAYQVMTKLTEIPQPDGIFVLLEEHPDSINDGMFVSDPGAVGVSARLVDYPAYFHLGAANLGMADGHVAYWRWADARTMPPVTGYSALFNVNTPNNPDVTKIAASTSYRK
jgi:prepilin-type processing-associated H-X9-DG protein